MAASVKSLSERALLLAFLATIGAASAPVRIEVLRGEGANNNALAGFGTSIVVRVLDGQGAPARDVLVIFSAAESGCRVEFAGQGATAQALTDESGIAVAPRERPIGASGPVEIQVVANLGKEFANAVVHQMNLGVGGDADRTRELSLIRLPAQAGADRFRIRVEDGTGHPVPSANVLFVLRKLSRGGDPREISRQNATTGANGEASADLPHRAAGLEFLVHAESEDRRVTEYFALE